MLVKKGEQRLLGGFRVRTFEAVACAFERQKLRLDARSLQFVGDQRRHWFAAKAVSTGTAVEPNR